MPSFEELFIQSGDDRIIYNGIEIVQFDKFPVKNNDILICSIEEAVKKKGRLQGFCVDVTGYAEIDGEIFRKGKGIRLHFWDESFPNEVRIKVFTKLDYVIIYNVCEKDVIYHMADASGNSIEKHSKTVDYLFNGCAMIVEEINGGRRYRCSDPSPTDKPFPFNDIVFTVKKTPSEDQSRSLTTDRNLEQKVQQDSTNSTE